MTIEWDPSPGEVVGYRVYVGAAPGVYHTTIDVPDRTRFVYMGAQRGDVYYFAVAARAAGGALSALSNEVSGVASTEIIRPVIGPPDTFEREPYPFAALAERQPPGCHTPRCSGAAVVAEGPGTITAMAITPDGRLFFVENDQRVGIAHTVTNAAVRAEVPGPECGGRGAACEGVARPALAVAPDFAATGFVFVAETALRRDLTRELRIVRYRAVGDTLSEPATVVAGLPGASVTAASLAAGDRAGVFVALPSAASAMGRDPYAGQVLAFAADGRTRPSDGASAPVIGPAGAAPAGLFWDRERSHLWFASLERQALVRIDAPAGRQPRIAATLALPVRLRSVTIGRAGDAIAVGLISDQGAVYRGTVDAFGRLGPLTPIALPADGTPTTLAFDAHGQLYAALQVSGRWLIAKSAVAPTSLSR